MSKWIILAVVKSLFFSVKTFTWHTLYILCFSIYSNRIGMWCTVIPLSSRHPLKRSSTNLDVHVYHACTVYYTISIYKVAYKIQVGRPVHFSVLGLVFSQDNLDVLEMGSDKPFGNSDHSMIQFCIIWGLRWQLPLKLTKYTTELILIILFTIRSRHQRPSNALANHQEPHFKYWLQLRPN